jgi:hypothetical protein
MAKPLSHTPIADGFMSPAEADPIIARFAVEEAKNGNPWPLICRLRSDQLSDVELNYISERGIQHGKRGDAELRKARDAHIRLQFTGLIAGGMKNEAAVKMLQEKHGLKRSSVFEILKKSSRGG